MPWRSCCEPAMNPEGGWKNLTHYNSGVYTIQTGPFSKSEVWCDMEAAGGGWLTILRRTESDCNVNFDNKFESDYLDGFGDLRSDFWLGLRTMHLLTKNGDCEMRVDLYDRNNQSTANINYSIFKVENSPDYTLKVNGFNTVNASLADSLGQFDGMVFKSPHKKPSEKTDCATGSGRGGWWYLEETCAIDGSVLTKSKHDLGWFVYSIPGDVSSQKIREKFSRYEVKIRPNTCNK